MKTTLFLMLIIIGISTANAEEEKGCIKKEVYGRCVTFAELFINNSILFKLPETFGILLSGFEKELVKKPVEKTASISASQTTPQPHAEIKTSDKKADCGDDLDWNAFVECANQRMEKKSRK
jgi:hypothetical protein